MVMRAVALLLVVSLVSPAVVSVVCELSCLRVLHHATGAAYASDCHEHGASAARDTSASKVSGAGALCHDDGEWPTTLAVGKAPGTLASATAVVHKPNPAARLGIDGVGAPATAPGGRTR